MLRSEGRSIGELLLVVAVVGLVAVLTVALFEGRGRADEDDDEEADEARPAGDPAGPATATPPSRSRRWTWSVPPSPRLRAREPVTVAQRTDRDGSDSETDPHRGDPLMFDAVKGFGLTFSQMFRKVVTEKYPEVMKPTAPRYHGRHVLNRHPDGLEKCVGCELCAWACPADAIYVEGGDNTEEARYSPGERYGAVYQINYLRCIFCGLCIEACPTRSLTMTNEYELADRQPAGPDLHEGAADGAAAARAWRRRRTRCGSATPSRPTTSTCRPGPPAGPPTRPRAARSRRCRPRTTAQAGLPVNTDPDPDSFAMSDRDGNR